MGYDDYSLMDEDEELLNGDGAAPAAPVAAGIPEQVPGAPDEAVLQAIRAKRDSDIGLANAFEGISSLGAGIAGQKIDPSMFEGLRQNAQVKAGEAQNDAKLKQNAVINFIKNQRHAEKDKATLAHQNKVDENTERHQRTMEQIARDALKQKDRALDEKASPGQAAVDKEYGKDYATRVSGGGYTMAQKGLKQLDDAIEKLKNTDMATGPVVSLLPDAVRSRVLPQSQAIKDAVEEIVQRNLRPTLGAQFTENEGKQLIARAYNPALPESENIKRLQRLGVQMRQALETQKAADDYFKEHGTLRGFEGKVFQNADDFDLEGGSDKHAPPASGGLSPEKKKRLEELRAKAGRK